MTVANFYRWTVLFITLILLACSDSVQRITSTLSSVHPKSPLVTLLSDSTSLCKPLHSFSAVKTFYTLNQFKQTWVSPLSITPQGDSLIKLIEATRYFGLSPADYHASAISKYRNTFHQDTTGGYISSELDILLTDAWLAIGHHLRYGRVHPDSSFDDRHFYQPDTSLLARLSRNVDQLPLRQQLEALEPITKHYQALKKELKQKLDSLKEKNLTAVQVAVLNKKISHLEVNLEQWRWEKEDFTQEHIFVNIPSYTLQIRAGDTVKFDSRVVVGSIKNQTPTLSSTIKTFVIYPYWNVPRKIAVDELLPKIKQDSGYLASHGYRIIDMKGNVMNADSIEWAKTGKNHFPFMIQQSEGAHNALGIIKFVFQNPYGVYLHDTNAKRYFNKSYRALSHGCVRVEKAVSLAKYLLAPGKDVYGPDDLSQELLLKNQRQISLTASMPLHIRYYTCEVNEDGSVTYYDDVYHKNDPLKDALYCYDTPHSL